MNARQFHADGSGPHASQIFVFGSNLSGIHGGGAARAAHQHYGAEWGVAEGRTGQCYAIPTVKAHIAGPLDLETIRAGIERFLHHAATHPEDSFLVTRVGCVLAGHSDADIAPMFRDAPLNCSLPLVWREYVTEEASAGAMNIVKARVLQLLSEHAEDHPVDLIKDTHQFTLDLGMDSEDLADLRRATKNEFGMEFTQEEEDALFGEDCTVAQLVNWVEAWVALQEDQHVHG